jgi:hypothetical protein|tara:strand:+ start:2570 stop:2779 length:210 start_codon:yes stop_codon:yes gene_type:complete
MFDKLLAVPTWVAAVVTVLLATSGCALQMDSDALKSQLDSLEEKVNTALQNSASAKIDASTALHLMQKK